MSTSSNIKLGQLGRNGPMVPRMGLGLLGLSLGDSVADTSTILPDEERLGLLDHAWRRGATLWDTSAAYRDSEDLLGKWFRLHPERRADVFLATKFAVRADFSEAATRGPRAYMDTSPAWCRESCETSLRRLGIDCIDLFYVQRYDEVTPIEKTVEAMAELKREGKIKHLGLCECSSSTLRRAHAVHPITAVQIEYSPWSLDAETERGTNLLATCRELGVAVVPYSPLGRGFLGGRIRSRADLGTAAEGAGGEEAEEEKKDDGDDKEGEEKKKTAGAAHWRNHYPRFAADNFAHNLSLVEGLEAIAFAADPATTQEKKPERTLAQFVLAWILAQGDDMFPIPGTRSPRRVDENAGAAAPGMEVTPAEDAAVRDLLRRAGGPAGSRHAEGIAVQAQNWADTAPLRE